MNHEPIEKGTLVLEYLRGNLYAFHIVVNVEDNEFKRLEFMKNNNLNNVRIFTNSLAYFEEWKLNGYSYKYINKE